MEVTGDFHYLRINYSCQVNSNYTHISHVASFCYYHSGQEDRIRKESWRRVMEVTGDFHYLSQSLKINYS